MEANKLQQLRANPPKSIDEVDAWMANYLALADEARAEAARVDRLHAAAPDLVKALQSLRKQLLVPNLNEKEIACIVGQIDAALVDAGA